MKFFLSAAALASMQIFVTAAYAQSPEAGTAVTRAEKKAEGIEAARHYMPGDGDPKPEARAKASKAERTVARQARKTAGTEASRDFMPGEGDPAPEATARPPRAERKAERKAKRAAIAKANKAGQLPSYDDNYGGK